MDIPNTSQWRIVVAEDEYDSIRMVSKILQYNGCDVQVAHNGIECLDLVEQSMPTMVIMDLAMPQKDGWQTLAALRANPATSHIPVVAVTAYYTPNLAEDALKAGFDGCFPKPVSPHTFVPSLERILERARYAE